MSDERKAGLPFAGAHGWAAMCDAPKDGTEILVWTHRQQHELARWDDDKHAKKPRPYWRTTGPWGVTDMRQIPPLAWMTLPPPPNGSR